MIADLQPCPFCRSTAVDVVGRSVFVARCASCDGQTGGCVTPQEAAAAWNNASRPNRATGNIGFRWPNDFQPDALYTLAATADDGTVYRAMDVLFTRKP